jgi:hypothetical protein
MGHANISITLDRSGHLMPGSEEEAPGLLDNYVAEQLERADNAARSAGCGQLIQPGDLVERDPVDQGGKHHECLGESSA